MSSITLTNGTVRVRGLQYNTRAYVVNGRNAMRKYDGTNWSLAGIATLRFIPTVGVTGTGVLEGAYRYFISPINSLLFTGSGLPIAGNPSQLSRQVSPSKQQVSITGIPATHPDPQVNFWSIFRCKANAYDPAATQPGQNFFFVANVPIGTTSYTDNTPDGGLAVNNPCRQNQNIPPTVKNIAIFGDRMFGFGFDPITTGTVSKTNVTISAGSYANNTVSLTTSTPHGLSVGQYVVVNTGDPQWDGAVQVLTVADATHFTYVPITFLDAVAPTASSKTGTLEVITFSGVSLDDGMAGCWFTSTDGQQYRVTAWNSATQLCLDKPYSTALSAAAYTIYQHNWDVFVSDIFDVEAWGPDGFANRFVRPVPGFFQVVGALDWYGSLLCFTPNDIYAITGKDADITNIQMSPEPMFRGLGAMGVDCIDTVEDEIHFMTRRGPAVLKSLNALEPQLTGTILLTDWFDSLTSADLGISVVGCEGRYVYFAVVATTGDAEVSTTYRYDRYLQEWYKERFWHPYFFYHDLGTDGKPNLFYAQGADLLQPNQGIVDVVTAALSGVVTSGSGTGIADTGAAFPTATGGLTEAYVHLFDAAWNYQGSRRINTNTATSVTWLSSGPGGGSVSGVAAGWHYIIGSVYWYWYTALHQTPPNAAKAIKAQVLYDNYVDASTSAPPHLVVTSLADGKVGVIERVAMTDAQKDYELNVRNHDLQLLLESYDGGVIRGVGIDEASKVGRK